MGGIGLKALRRIGVVTGSRADYGILYWLLKEIADDSNLELQLMATGMHLSAEFGLTYRVIEQDGFKINEKVEMLLSGDTPQAMIKSLGLGTIGFADTLSRLAPDLVVLQGDRFEMLAAAQAALMMKIPCAHIHGGEASEGAVDEAIRHAITKMSHLHFVANDVYRQRVIQLGENPHRVFNFGAPGLDNIRRLKLLDREALENLLNFRFGSTNFLVTYHPETLGRQTVEESLGPLLEALDAFPEVNIIFTKPNADAGGRKMAAMIERYVAKESSRAAAFTSLGQLKYLSAVKHADVVIGNSSSGIVEVPAMKKPTVNIGDRQKGRLRAASVIDCEASAPAIKSAIKKALSTDFQRVSQNTESPFGDGDASKKIKEAIKGADLANILMKKFYDQP